MIRTNAYRSSDYAPAMRLLCCSDTHGRRPPPLDEDGAIAWLHAGDVESGPDVDASMLEVDPRLDPLLAPVATWFDSRPIPVHLVRGNHDCVDVYRAFDAGRDVGGRVVPLAPGVWLAGLGWHGERYFELPTDSDLMSALTSLERQLRRLAGPGDAVVLLSHYPLRADEARPAHPMNAEDSAGIRAFVDRVRPALVVEGHVHHRAGTSIALAHDDGRLTWVVNPGRAGCVVEIDVAPARGPVAVRPSFPLPRPGSAPP